MTLRDFIAFRIKDYLSIYVDVTCINFPDDNNGNISVQYRFKEGGRPDVNVNCIKF